MKTRVLLIALLVAAVVAAVVLYVMISRRPAPPAEVSPDREEEPAPAIAEPPREEPGPRVAVADLQPVGGSKVTGTVTFFALADDGGVRVEHKVKNLPPGRHGFHIHETGDCTSPDGASAGGHFNPEGTPHGLPEADAAHAGDMGNVVSNVLGRSKGVRVNKRATLGGGPADILGRAVAIHEKQDDGTAQPAGGAGRPIACGVIKPR
jgi:Cu-Zn family superoxide dismutase